jgi:hypothetical protein
MPRGANAPALAGRHSRVIALLLVVKESIDERVLYLHRLAALPA